MSTPGWTSTRRRNSDVPDVWTAPVLEPVVWADDPPVRPAGRGRRRLVVRQRGGVGAQGWAADAPPPTGAPFLGPDRVVLVTAEPVPKRSVKTALFRLWQFLVVLVLVVLLVLGGVSVVRPPARVPVDAIAASTAAAIERANPTPNLPAEGYALRVARVWFTYSPAGRDARRVTVANLMPGAAPDIAWDGVSTSAVTDAWVVHDYVVDDWREVHVAVQTDGGVRLLIVTVSVDAATGSTALVLFPSVGSQPAVGKVPAEPGATVNTDPGAQGAAAPTVEGFLRAWGSGVAADVAVFTDGFTAPPGPGGLKLAGAPRWTMPAGGAQRVVTVLVRWADTAGRVTPSAYSITLTTNGQRWSVKDFNVAAPGSISFTTNPSS